MILDDIKNYAKQFAYEPKVENAEKLGKKKFAKFVVAGMGGSQLRPAAAPREGFERALGHLELLFGQHRRNG